MRVVGGLGGAAASALLALASCTTTVDSIGYNGTGGVHLHHVTGPATYPNTFRGLPKTDAEITAKINGAFMQLFYGDANQAIYVPMGTEQASIQDTLHLDVRTEGIGLAMMVAVQLNKQAEFDRLWTFASMQKKQKAPSPRSGYFESSCDTLTPGTTTPCDDPFGESQMVTALIFANDRWGSAGTVNYETGAVDLLTVMRHKQDENGGIVDGITDTFDTTTALPFDLPVVGRAGVGRPSIVMPAYYDVWFQATGDAFWSRAAAAARDYWKKAAHPTTGLTPVRATFDGKPYANWENFGSESYRAQINIALDWAWAKGAKDQWEVDEASRLLDFFNSKGIDTYGTSYELDGTLIDPARDFALIAANGVDAMVAINTPNRMDYVTDVWEMAIPTGPARYYSGILYLTALLILGGQYQVL